MIAKELRIGNLVHVPATNQNVPVTGISEYVGVVVNNALNWIGFDDIEPITLTEEWLERFGFEGKFDNKEYGISFGRMDFFVTKSMHVRVRYDEGRSLIPLDCKHVHSLQNLYFALTGEELELKES